jgi:hypothetical protein
MSQHSHTDTEPRIVVGKVASAVHWVYAPDRHIHTSSAAATPLEGNNQQQTLEEHWNMLGFQGRNALCCAAVLQKIRCFGNYTI